MYIGLGPEVIHLISSHHHLSLFLSLFLRFSRSNWRTPRERYQYHVVVVEDDIPTNRSVFVIGHLTRTVIVRCATRPRSKTSGPGGRTGGNARVLHDDAKILREQACGFKNVQRRRRHRRHHLNGPTDTAPAELRTVHLPSPATIRWRWWYSRTNRYSVYQKLFYLTPSFRRAMNPLTHTNMAHNIHVLLPICRFHPFVRRKIRR